MGFNITQIINKFVPVKSVDSDLRENPFNTLHGQEIVSVQENFWARLNREGHARNAILTDFQPTADNTFRYSTLYTPSIGAILYPSVITLSADIDCDLAIKITTGVNDIAGVSGGQDFYFMVHKKAREEWKMDFKGDLQVFADNGGKISVGGRLGSAGKLHASFLGVEVMPNV